MSKQLWEAFPVSSKFPMISYYVSLLLFIFVSYYLCAILYILPIISYNYKLFSTVAFISFHFQTICLHVLSIFLLAYITFVYFPISFQTTSNVLLLCLFHFHTLPAIITFLRTVITTYRTR